MSFFDLIYRRIQPQIQIPSSKSQTLRALIFASMARGVSTIENPLQAEDTDAMIRCLEALGVRIEKDQKMLKVYGGMLRPTKQVLDCGQSGIVLRFLGALMSHFPQYTILTGHPSLCAQRPVDALIEGLNQLGAVGVSSFSDGRAPLFVRGPWIERVATIQGADSQPVSALLIAASMAPFPIKLSVMSLGERPWVELTLDWLKRMGVDYQEISPGVFIVNPSPIAPFHYRVSGDWSSAAFFAVGALITGQKVYLSHLDPNDPQGDREFFTALQTLGAHLDISSEGVWVYPSSPLNGGVLSINRFIDALPILAVLGVHLKEPLELIDAEVARTKECDRIHAICLELSKMGAHLEEKPSGLKIFPSKLKGAVLDAHEDHRIAMSLAIASLVAEGGSRLRGARCVAKTYPEFFQQLCT